MVSALVSVWLLAAAPSPADESFAKARQMLSKGETAEACDLFSESFELEPALGTLLNLALCHEKLGRWASAWLEFNQAEAWAARTHEASRQALAAKRAAAIHGRLTWLAFSTPKAVPGLQVSVQGQLVRLVGPASAPVDPGTVTVVASADGFQSYTTTVVVPDEPKTISVRLPALEPLVRSTPAPEAPPPPPLLPARDDADALEASATQVRSSAKTLPQGVGIGLVSAGAALAVAGAIGLGYSLDTYQRAQPQRVSSTVQPETFISKEQLATARVLYPSSIVSLGLGAACVVAGSVVLARGPQRQVTVTMSPMPEGLSVSAAGSF